MTNISQLLLGNTSLSLSHSSISGSICATFIPLTCGNSSCLNGGTCFISGNRTICQCPALFTGARCDMLISPCDSKCIGLECFLRVHIRLHLSGQPCVNGASCQVTGLGRKKRQIVSGIAFLCVCTNGFTGTRCESFLSFCLSNPCTNNGTCTQDFLTNTVRCLCPPNFTGTFCNATNNATNPCTINPGLCVNGGTCRPNASIPQGYTCTCPPTATGVYCEQPIDPCRSSLAPNCTNNGTCVSSFILCLSEYLHYFFPSDFYRDGRAVCLHERFHWSNVFNSSQSMCFSTLFPQRHLSFHGFSIVSLHLSNRFLRQPMRDLQLSMHTVSLYVVEGDLCALNVTIFSLRCQRRCMPIDNHRWRSLYMPTRIYRCSMVCDTVVFELD